MAYTEEQLTALKTALATGATRVKMNGEEVEYRSLAEMRSIIATMERELGRKRPAVFQPTYSKGT